MTICGRCGAVFTESPILALYEHYERAHGIPEMRYYETIQEKPLAPNPHALDPWYLNSQGRIQRRKSGVIRTVAP